MEMHHRRMVPRRGAEHSIAVSFMLWLVIISWLWLGTYGTDDVDVVTTLPGYISKFSDDLKFSFSLFGFKARLASQTVCAKARLNWDNAFAFT